MKRLLGILIGLFSLASLANDVDSRLNTLEERLDSIEINNALDKLNFSGSDYVTVAKMMPHEDNFDCY